MFDPTQPNNQLPLLPTDFNYDQVDILKQVNQSNIALANLNIRAERLPNSLLLVNPLLIRESVASSGIENINTTVYAVFEAEILEEKRTGPAKEVLHYKDSMLEGLEIVRKKGFLSTNDFVHLQSVIEPNKTGVRKLEVKIKNDRTGEILYTPPMGEHVIRDLLKNLENFVNNHEDGIDPLVKMAMFHYQFESIHPFLDGNGRVGRILMILYLVMTGRLKLPVLYISGYIQDHKNLYYSSLHEANEKNDYKDLILYMLKAVEEQAQQTEQSIIKIEQLMNKVEAIIGKRMRVHSKELLNCLFSRALLTIDYVQEYLKLSSRQTASKYLQTLTKHGYFEEKKLGRHKFFFSKEFCKLLS